MTAYNVFLTCYVVLSVVVLAGFAVAARRFLGIAGERSMTALILAPVVVATLPGIVCYVVRYVRSGS